ncbi:MAG TPA: hypothetical protein VGK19_03065 [Capsulimonadaceae bacterium]
MSAPQEPFSVGKPRIIALRERFAYVTYHFVNAHAGFYAEIGLISVTGVAF